MGRRQQFDLCDIYRQLTQAGHSQIWLREVHRPNPYKRILITWDNYVLGCYKPVTGCWYLCKMQIWLMPTSLVYFHRGQG